MTAAARKPDPPPGPVPAQNQLVALAVATRPDWHPADVREALAAAHTVGLTWPRVLADMGRLMAAPGSAPRDLVPAVWDPRLRHRPVDPETNARRAAEIRAAMHTRTSDPALEGGEPR